MPSITALALRKPRRMNLALLSLALVAVVAQLSGLLSSDPVQALPTAERPMVLAVGYFDNRSEAAEWQALSKGLADMLITDLADTEGVTMVERDRLQALLGEIKLGKSAFVDPASAAKLGKGLGASHILLGAYHIHAGKLRIDARAVDVAQGTVGATAQESGSADDVFSIEAKLAERLRQQLQVKKKATTLTPPKVTAEDVRAYGQGLEALDEGRMEDARRILSTLAARKPDFAQVQRGLDQMSRKIKQLLDNSKVAPEKALALAEQVEAGKVEACMPFNTEVTNLTTAATKASLKILMPDGSDKNDLGRLLASYYALVLNLLDRPGLQQPVCFGQAPAAMALAQFLFVLHTPARAVLGCEETRIAQMPNPDQVRRQCERTMQRVPDLTDASGKVMVNGRDLPLLMVQMGQVMLDRYPASPYMQSLLPMIQEYVEHLRLAGLKGKDKDAAMAAARTQKARAAILQHTAYADLYLGMAMAPGSPQQQSAMPGLGLRLQLGISEGDIAMGTGRIEVSRDAGKTWHLWPQKEHAAGWAYPHLNVAVQPGARELVGLVESKEGNPPQPKVELTAGKWHTKAGWLGAPWSEAQMVSLVARLVGEDGTELIRCPLAYDAELTARANAAWLYGKLLCKGG